MDRISPLPDCVIHDIFSFLNTQQVVQTCVLSKRWKTLWTHIPTLNFDINSYQYQFDDSKSSPFSLNVEESFQRFVVRVLTQHRGLYIQKLIYSYFVYDEGRFLIKALDYAPFQRAQQLVITTDYVFHSLCSSLSACKFLSVLKISCLGAAHLESLVLPSLKTLVLDICPDYSDFFYFDHYYYDDVDWHEQQNNDDYDTFFNEKTFSGCPNLECLVLHHFRELSACVFAPKLEILELENDVLSYKRRSQELVLCAPNLTSVKFTNVLPFLKSASEFEFIDNVYIAVDNTNFRRRRSQQRMEKNLCQLLKVFHKATSFILPPIATQVMFKSPSLDGCCFHNLRHLEFKTNLSKEMIEVPLSLYTFSNFIECPNLQTYTLDLESVTTSLSLLNLEEKL